jgi:DNA polymerase (family 10)
MAERLAAQRANPYRVRAYRKAADAIEALLEDIGDVAARQALEDIDGVGRDLADKIEEFLRTGTIQAYEALRIPLPDSVKTWKDLPGLSESLVAYLYSRLGITTLADLEQLVRSHMLRTIPGYSGSDDRLLEAIAARQQSSVTKHEEAP